MDFSFEEKWKINDEKKKKKKWMRKKNILKSVLKFVEECINMNWSFPSEVWKKLYNNKKKLIKSGDNFVQFKISGNFFFILFSNYFFCFLTG